MATTLNTDLKAAADASLKSAMALVRETFNQMLECFVDPQLNQWFVTSLNSHSWKWVVFHCMSVQCIQATK